jgi:hypothetical protein
MRNRMTLTIAAIAAACSILAVAASAAGLQKQPDKRSAQQRDPETKPVSNPPLACNLFGLTSAQRLRQQELHKQLFSQAEGVRELPNGYAVGVPGTKENVLAVAEFITLERVCCSFFRFEIAVGQPEEPLWLRITGGEGVKEFLKSEFKLK